MPAVNSSLPKRAEELVGWLYKKSPAHAETYVLAVLAYAEAVHVDEKGDISTRYREYQEIAAKVAADLGHKGAKPAPELREFNSIMIGLAKERQKELRQAVEKALQEVAPNVSVVDDR